MLASEVAVQGELLRIGADAARTRATGSGVRVAVVDTGLLPEHASLDGHVDGDDGYDFVEDDDDPTDETNDVDDDDDGYVDEDYAHGTFVASLVLAVAPHVVIVGYRVLNADGIGSTIDVARGIMRAVQEGADIVNLSVHVPSTATAILSAIEYAASHGVQVVVSAGNTGNGAAFTALSGDGTMTVTAVDEDDVLADFATYGAGVTLSAPGVDLSGAYPEDPGTAVWSGTSFAAALVSGGCALLHQIHPTWTIAQVKTRILDTLVSVESGNPMHEDDMGAGRLDLDAATEP
jgi:subtilisin family serine protease